ncbi:uncharacterized protein HaLaN_11724, partial [Haematococcus lacustris]
MREREEVKERMIGTGVCTGLVPCDGGGAGRVAPARPMTSNRGAGFTSVPNKKFDPLSQTRASTGAGAKAQLLQKADSSLEEQAKELERKVHELLELSAATLNK